MARLSMSLLGPLRVTLDGEPVTGFAYDKVRALLAYLACEADRPHRREALAGLLWPDRPEAAARHSLRQALSQLRQAIGDREATPPFLRVTREAIQLNPDSDHWLDVAAFTALLDTCKRHGHRHAETCEPCARRLQEAAELYGGHFLQQFSLRDSAAFEEWAVLNREWLCHLVLEALDDLVGHHQWRGEYGEACRWAWRQVELEPSREKSHRRLMLLLARSGQRGAALAQYETCRRALAEELDVEPSEETRALYQRIRAAPPTPPHNLPLQPTPFVGREEELAAMARRLADPTCRLVTVVGPGGIGKTRLALQAARQHRRAFLNGVTFVPLASVGSAELLVPAIADALGFSFHGREDPKAQLLNYLREKELLLVLDSFEHLLRPPSVPPAPLGPPNSGGKWGRELKVPPELGGFRGAGGATGLLLDILRGAPEVKLLVTSRERLNLRWEWRFEIEGLAYPDFAGILRQTQDGVSDVEIRNSQSEIRNPKWSAVQLFLQRARQVQAGFSLSGENGPSVVRICQLVEGMPLGVELAAAWVGELSCEAIPEAIQGNLDILSTTLRDVPPRHRSVRVAFEHSWNLLTEEEKGVFRKLSVFRGGFADHAAAQVARAPRPVLSALVAKSLLRRESSGRYGIHELLRQYGAEKLRAQLEQAEEARDRHCGYYATFLQQREEDLKGERQAEALGEIEREIENVRVGWQWAVDREKVAALEKSLPGLYLFYEMRSRFSEAEEAFSKVVATLDEAKRTRGSLRKEARAVLGKVLARQGAACWRLGSHEKARHLLRESLTIFRQFDMWEEMAFAFHHLAAINHYEGQYGRAKDLHQQSLAIRGELGDKWGIATSLNNLGFVIHTLGDYPEAKRLHQESLTIRRAIGDRLGMATSLNALAVVTNDLGQRPEAERHLRESLSIHKELGNRYGVMTCLANLGTIAYMHGEHGSAKPLFQESLAVCRELGHRLATAHVLDNLGHIAYLEGNCDEAKYLHEESLSIRRQVGDQKGEALSLGRLGAVAHALGRGEEAWAYFHQALEMAMSTRAIPAGLLVLVEMVTLLAEGERQEEAVELLALIQNHPASGKETQIQAERLFAELASQLPSQVVATAWERGRGRTFEEVVEELLDEKASRL